MLPGLIRCRDEHPSLQDLHHVQNSMPEIKHFEMMRRGQHDVTQPGGPLCMQGGMGIPWKSLTWGHELKPVLKAVLV